MGEVEAIINSTPMTTPSGNLNDFEVLTRNFILTKKSGVILPQFGAFQSADIYFRKIWRRVLYAATVFWTRWSGNTRRLFQSGICHIVAWLNVISLLSKIVLFQETVHYVVYH